MKPQITIDVCARGVTGVILMYVRVLCDYYRLLRVYR